MFSLDITLKDFVCSIPICQSKTDLGNILNIFYQTNCSSIAVCDEKRWGIITSQKLLASLAKSWQRYPVARVGYPKNFQYSDFTLAIEDFDNLVESVTIYRADTSLVEFLGNIDSESLCSDGEKYLVSDRLGRLLGELDVAKLLKYVGSKFSQLKTNSHLLTLSPKILSSFDSIALPIKIKTVAGENLYQNEYWQKLISQPEDRHLTESRSDISIANWWIEQQLNTLSPDKSGKNQPIGASNNNPDKHCCLDARYYSIARSDTVTENALSDLDIELERLSSNLSEHFEASSLTEGIFQPVADRSIEIERGTKWSYFKIPIALNPQQLSTNKASTCWLILAIEIPTVESEADKSGTDLPLTSTADKLLGTLAHELKSPLTGIVGLSSLLKAQKLGTLNQRQYKYVELIYNGGQKLMNIIKDLLKFTALTTKKSDIKPEAIDLQSCCEEVYQEVIAKLQSSNGRELDRAIVSTQLQPEIEPGREIAIADRTLLSTVLSHLMSEAIQFTNAIATPKVKIQSQDEHLAITIGNNISFATSRSQPNFSSIESPVQLNLIMAKHLVKVIGGKIEIIETEDGCQYSLLLPLDKSQPTQAKTNSQPSKQSDRSHRQKNLTILCLYPESEVIAPQLASNRDLNLQLKHWVEQGWADIEQKCDYQYRILEADGLEQAHTLARIWQLDAIVIDGHQIGDCSKYLRSLQQSEYLSTLPLITLDTKTTEAANLIEGLNVYPCLLPIECRNVKDLIQVIQIATGI